MAAKMIDKLEIACVSFLRIKHCHNGLDTKKKSRRKI